MLLLLFLTRTIRTFLMDHRRISSSSVAVTTVIDSSSRRRQRLEQGGRRNSTRTEMIVVVVCRHHRCLINAVPADDHRLQLLDGKSRTKQHPSIQCAHSILSHGRSRIPDVPVAVRMSLVTGNYQPYLLLLLRVQMITARNIDQRPVRMHQLYDVRLRHGRMESADHDDATGCCARRRCASSSIRGRNGRHHRGTDVVVALSTRVVVGYRMHLPRPIWLRLPMMVRNDVVAISTVVDDHHLLLLLLLLLPVLIHDSPHRHLSVALHREGRRRRWKRRERRRRGGPRQERWTITAATARTGRTSSNLHSFSLSSSTSQSRISDDTANRNATSSLPCYGRALPLFSLYLASLNHKPTINRWLVAARLSSLQKISWLDRGFPPRCLAGVVRGISIPKRKMEYPGRFQSSRLRVPQLRPAKNRMTMTTTNGCSSFRPTPRAAPVARLLHCRFACLLALLDYSTSILLVDHTSSDPQQVTAAI